MNILFITSRIPFPPFRGDKVRTFRLLKELSNHGHKITLVSFVSSLEEKKYEIDLQQYCQKIILIKLSTLQSVLNCFLGIFSPLPFQILYFRSHSMKKTIDSLLSSENYDLVHVHLIRMLEYVKHHQHIQRVIDLTDAGSLYLNRFIQHEKSIFKKGMLNIELNRLKEYEKNILNVQTNLVCSEKDKSVLLNTIPDANIHVIHNGIDLTQMIDSYVSDPGNKRIIFTGNLTYFPNIDAIEHFVKEIFPKILREEPDATFYIVGQNPPSVIRKLVTKNIFVTGFVENIVHEYLKSSVAVAPIRFGAGSQFKILEALAIGIPVVTTSITAEGINSINNNELLVANNPEDFAAAVVKLFRDQKLRNSLTVNGKKMIQEKYSMEVIGHQLNDLYVSIVGKS